MLKIIVLAILILLISCEENIDHDDHTSIELISTFNSIEYLNAHPIIDTSKVRIPQNYSNIIAVKKEEQQLLTLWLNEFHKNNSETILEVWQKFSNILELITLELKVIQLKSLNPRIVYLRKEAFYRELGLPFKPFANVPVIMILQNQLQFAQNLLENYPQDSTKVILDNFFRTHTSFSENDEKALRFDLMRWYKLKNEGVFSIREKEIPQ